jgi:hypothetical protein
VSAARATVDPARAECRAYVYQCNFRHRNLSPTQKKELLRQMKKTAKALREQDKKRFTQKVVARMLGIDQSTVSRWFIPNMHMHNRNNGQPAPPAEPTDEGNGEQEAEALPSSRPDAKVKIPREQIPVIVGRLRGPMLG